MSRLLYRLYLALCLSMGSGPALADSPTLGDLMARGELQLDAWLEPTSGIVPGQEIQLVIEIATQRWFAGGTDIRHPDVRNLVVLRRDSFANNLSRREGAITWVIQRWHLELYPQATGRYQVPPVELELAVNDALTGVVRGKLQTPALEFTARIPAALETIDSWVATPQLALEHEIDRQAQGLAPGDAFTRQITLRASNVTAMMLPVVSANGVEGLPAYEDTSQLRDLSNRGEATAERRQSITYVVERAGQYVLPEQVFYWWDTVNRELETAVLPALAIDAGQPAGRGEVAATSAQRFILRGHLFEQWWLALGAGVAAIIALLAWRYRRRGVSETRLLRQLGRALRKGRHEQAAALLYRWLNHFAPRPDWYQLRVTLRRHAGKQAAEAADSLLAAVYAGHAGGQAIPPIKIRRARGVARLIPEHLLKPVELKLNPGDSAARQRASY